jgi:hypothetical protein
LGIGDWGLGPIPNPQSPIPNPQSPQKILIEKIQYIIYAFIKIYLKYEYNIENYLLLDNYYNRFNKYFIDFKYNKK